MTRKYKITNSALYKIYINELYDLTCSVEMKIDILLDNTKLPDEGNSRHYSQENLNIISEILAKSANIKKFLSGAPYQYKNENDEVYSLRKQREDLFSNLLMGIDLSVVLSIKVRNTLEHLEEYLDNENINIRLGNRGNVKFVAYNQVISDWGLIKIPIIPVKVYVACEHTFYNLDWSINIIQLKQAIISIRKRLEMKGVTHFSDDPFFVSGLIKIKK